MATKQQQSDSTLFKQKLTHYKQLLNADIAVYTQKVQRSTLQKFGAHSRVATDAYLEILGRGGKRIRGALAMVGYEMSGGTDVQMIVQAARAVEMIHAYILIMDDINDRSPTRRGGPAAHKLMTQYHQAHHFADDHEHFGESIAMNAALIGNHAAQELLANLSTDPVRLLKAISVMNHGMITTAHGQFNDIFNEVDGTVTERDVSNVMEWKTAHYTFLNPLTFGMVLAGAESAATAAIADYALNAGIAFQISDDILGVFGQEQESGKSPLDDIREGKRTLLTIYALEHAPKADKHFLIQMLGKHDLSQTEFVRCKDILIESGALEYAQKQTEQHVQASLVSLDTQAKHWGTEGVTFLRGLTTYLLGRKS